MNANQLKQILIDLNGGEEDHGSMIGALEDGAFLGHLAMKHRVSEAEMQEAAEELHDEMNA